MGNNVLKYTNGVGHLIISIVLVLVGLALVLVPQSDGTLKGVGIGLITSVSAAWLVPGAAKQVAYQVQNALPVSQDTVKTPAVKPTTGDQSG